MQPRFDYLSDGVGVVLNGRMAQAIAKDCPSDEPMVWIWSGQGERTVRLETAPYRNSANMCLDAQALPRSAGRQAQARIAPLKAYFANLTASREPIIRSDFDVYLIDGSLIYAKSQCGQADVDAPFFANIYPVDADDLPARLRQRGYETIDFNFDDYGAIADDRKCLAALNLQDYPIAEIHAGQYVELADGYAHIWEGAYHFNE